MPPQHADVPETSSMTPSDRRSSGRRIALKAWRILLPLVLVALVVALQFTQAGHWFSPERLGEAAQAFPNPIAAGAVVCAIFIVAINIMTPLTLLLGATAVAFSGLQGAVTAWIAAQLSCWVGFALGRYLIGAWVTRRAGRTARSAERVRNHGLAFTLLIRLVPMAPALVVNLIAGASRIRWRDYVVGNALGTLPAVVFFTLLGDEIRNAIRNPTGQQIAIAAATAVVLFGLLNTARKILWRRFYAQTDLQTDRPGT